MERAALARSFLKNVIDIVNENIELTLGNLQWWEKFAIKEFVLLGEKKAIECIH